MVLFAGFESFDRQVNGTTIHGVVGGSGPPLLLLHGYPQTHAMWHRVAPRLARENTVICPDLRGYGDSAAPASDVGHLAYSKREMARDQVELMAALGHRRFAVAGHDRGGRVARRMALDHPAAVTHLAVLDIVPTRLVYGALDQTRATTVWRYFFLIQPAGLPERLIGADPHWYLDRTLAEWCGDGGGLDPAAVAEYHRCFDAGTIRASCEDYRAGASVDLAHDAADAGRRIACPLLVLWSAKGLGASYDVPASWAQEAYAVDGQALDCGHFLAEERPNETAAALSTFLFAH